MLMLWNCNPQPRALYIVELICTLDAAKESVCAAGRVINDRENEKYGACDQHN